MANSVAFVLKGYPRLSETFIAQEILGLEQRGLNIRIYSLRQPREPERHPIHSEIAAPVTYLPEYLKDDPARVAKSWNSARRLPGYAEARRLFLRDLRRDRTANRIRRFGQAIVLAAELPAEVRRLHAHFLHTPASVARYAAVMRALPWSCSAHAKDIWTTPEWEEREKLASLDWLTTCTEAGRAHLAALADDPQKVGLAYHGLDLARFPPPAGERPARDGSDPDDPAVLLSVGRAVPKKGFDVLLEALSRLPSGLNWRFVHIGAGELQDALKAQAERLGLSGAIEWRGSQTQQRVLAAYREADLFVMPSRIAPDGDRDGLPNVLMEAQSQALACLATEVSAIPELIRHEETGTLAPPDDPSALAEAMERLIRDPSRRQRLGEAGRRRVAADFAMAPGLDALAWRFGLPQPPTQDLKARSAAGR